MRSVRLSALCTAVILGLACGLAEAQTPLGTGFTYQGQLKDGGSLANGLYDVHFRLCDAATEGTQLGPIICYNNLSVADGLFTATLDFGDQFTGQERFLEIAIRIDAGQNCANTSGFTTLSPRQKLTAAPNATFALSADKLDGLDSTAFLQAIPVPLTLSGTYAGAYIISGENAAASTDSGGVYGRSTAAGGQTYGAYGRSDSTMGRGVFGYASAQDGPTYGGFFLNDSTMGRAVFGHATAASGTTVGGYFESDSLDGQGVFAYAPAASGTTYGLSARSASTSGRGVYGWATAGSGTTYGGYFSSLSSSGTGVFGQAGAATGATYGGRFESDSMSGLGVAGRANATSGVTYGVYGQSNSSTGYAGYFVGKGSDALYVINDANGRGIQVVATNDTALWASTTAGIAGVDGRNASTTGRGVYGYATASTGANYGVYGRTSSAAGTGIYGLASNTAGITYGGYFEAQSFQGTGVYGRATATGAGATPYGVAGYCNTATAGYAVYAAGDMGASGTKPFRIDHPIDPENKYLLHYSVESPEVLNAYSGKVTLDASGQAVVELPAYFANINKDPRYTLTAIGAPMPNLHVAEEISEQNLKAGEQAGPGVTPPTCSFRIAGGVADGKVSWRVEAVRNDLRMRLHGAPVEREKSGPEHGKYQHPEYYGQPPEKGMDYKARPSDPAEEPAMPEATAQ